MLQNFSALSEVLIFDKQYNYHRNFNIGLSLITFYQFYYAFLKKYSLQICINTGWELNDKSVKIIYNGYPSERWNNFVEIIGVKGF